MFFPQRWSPSFKHRTDNSESVDLIEYGRRTKSTTNSAVNARANEGNDDDNNNNINNNDKSIY